MTTCPPVEQKLHLSRLHNFRPEGLVWRVRELGTDGV